MNSSFFIILERKRTDTMNLNIVLVFRGDLAGDNRYETCLEDATDKEKPFYILPRYYKELSSALEGYEERKI